MRKALNRRPRAANGSLWANVGSLMLRSTYSGPDSRATFRLSGQKSEIAKRSFAEVPSRALGNQPPPSHPRHSVTMDPIGPRVTATIRLKLSVKLVRYKVIGV